LQGGQLRLQAGLILEERLLEEPALRGAHRLGLGTELPALQPRQLEVDLLQLGATPGNLGIATDDLGVALDELGVAPGDLLGLVLQQLILLLDALAHLRDQRGGLRRQSRQIHQGSPRTPSMPGIVPEARPLTPSAYALSTPASDALPLRPS
jgi:transposase